jgi:hypothetical protein
VERRKKEKNEVQKKKKGKQTENRTEQKRTDVYDRYPRIWGIKFPMENSVEAIS